MRAAKKEENEAQEGQTGNESGPYESAWPAGWSVLIGRVGRDGE